LGQIAIQIVEKAKKGKKLTVRDFVLLYLYLLRNKERRIEGDALTGGRGGCPSMLF
jgi:hypothetical protein